VSVETRSVTELKSRGRIPPNNLEAEAAVLGSLMLDRGAIGKIADFLHPDDFYFPAHGSIFQAALNLYERSEPIDLLTLSAELERTRHLDRIGGQEFLAELESGVPTAANVEYYARIVEDAATKRRLSGAGDRISNLAFDESMAADVAVDKAEEVVFAVAERRIRQDFVPLIKVLHETWDEIEKSHQDPSHVSGVPSGFNDLDAKTGGFQKGNLIVIAARPGIGKTSLVLNMAQHAAIDGKVGVGIFSLEMSEKELATRLLCSEARVDSYRLRRGLLKESEWEPIARAMGALGEAPIFIEESPQLSVLEMRTRARRLLARENVGMIIVDYLQLMQGRMTENRVQEISDISRSLKGLARELNVPVVACSQLSREPEKRPDHRPQLSDLRESGCLAGETKIYLPDTGQYKPIKELVGQVGFNVLALNPLTWKLESRPVLNAFSTGTKPIFKLTTQLGRSVRATANHKFRTIEGWKRLDELSVGTRIALPRRLPGPEQATMSLDELALLGHLIGDGSTLPTHAIQYTTNDQTLAVTVADLATKVFGDKVAPRIKRERDWLQVYIPPTFQLTHGVFNPVGRWLRELGLYGLRSYEKFVPDAVFRQPAGHIAHFLRHLWSTDGCIHMTFGKSPRPSIYYASSSRKLAVDVQSLLLRLGANGRLTRHPQALKGRDQFHVWVSGREDVEAFLMQVGALGTKKCEALEQIADFLSPRLANTNRDVLPREIWRMFAIPAMQSAGLTGRAMQAGLGNAYCGTRLYKQNLSRERAARLASVVASPELTQLAASDVYWDEIASIEADGVEEVYDLTVEDLHNFVAENLIAHNSIEQDSDLVLFIYRDKFYNENIAEDKKNVAEIIVAKHRNGPTGKVELLFIEEQTKFANLARPRG
jgi:replicative DNA helicase